MAPCRKGRHEYDWSVVPCREDRHECDWSFFYLDKPWVSVDALSDLIAAQASALCDDEGMEIVSLECHVLIIGKTGNGKSSVGNTLLGTDRFQVGSGMWSTTQKAQLAYASEGDKTLKVSVWRYLQAANPNGDRLTLRSLFVGRFGLFFLRICFCHCE